MLVKSLKSILYFIVFMISKKFFVSIFFVFLTTFGCVEKSVESCGKLPCIIGEVVAVIDGDTIKVKENDKEMNVRLSLVNTPEKNEKGYEEAKNFTLKSCPVGSRVIIDLDEKQLQGSYGRVIALVRCCQDVPESQCYSKPSLNQDLVDNGFAKMMLSYCNKSEFADQVWVKSNGC